MSNNIKVGIVGLGGGGRAHIDYFREIKGVQLEGLCDVKNEALKEVVQNYKLEDIFTTTNYDDLLARKDIDVISICNPDPYHADCCVKALYAGKHVLCEKPMVTSIEECNQVIKAVEDTGLVFAVQHQMRFVPFFSGIKSIIDSGEIGDIFVLEADYLHNLMERARRYDPWRLKPGNYHPPLLGAGCHFVDLFRWYNPSGVKEVFSYANHISFKDWPGEDCVMTLIKFNDGCIGKILTTFGCRRPMGHPIRVYGTKGTLVDNMLFEDRGLKKLIYDPPLDKRERLISWALNNVADRYEQYPFSLYEHELACINSIRNFFESIQKGTKPLIDVYEGAQTVAVCVAGGMSYQKKKPVEITKEMLFKD